MYWFCPGAVQVLTFHVLPRRANNSRLTRGPNPEAMLVKIAFVVYKELQQQPQIRSRHVTVSLLSLTMPQTIGSLSNDKRQSADSSNVCTQCHIWLDVCNNGLTCITQLLMADVHYAKQASSRTAHNCWQPSSSIAASDVIATFMFICSADTIVHIHHCVSVLDR